MRSRIGGIGLGGPVLALILLFAGPTPGEASHELFGLYENWDSSSQIRGDRWSGSETFGGQEIDRGLVPGPVAGDNRLLMRFRREGETSSDSGTATSQNALDFTNPAAIDQTAAKFNVTQIDVTGCAANPTASRVRPMRLILGTFNDGSSTGPGDRTGDHFGILQVQRDSSSVDPPGVLAVAAAIVRCDDSTCDTTTTVTQTLLPQTVAVGTKATLRMIWDPANDQFLFSVGPNPNVPLSYAPASDAAPAVVPFGGLRMQHTTANCTAAPTNTDATTEVIKVSTNTSAIIP